MKSMITKTFSHRTIKFLVSSLLILGALTLPNLTGNVFSQTQMATVTETIVSTSATMPPLPGAGCHWLWWSMIVAPGTSELVGTIGPPSSRLYFFIMNGEQESVFEADQCNGGYYAAIVSHPFDTTSSYELDWKNPPPGQYFFIFDNEAAPGESITVPFTLVGIFNLEQSRTTVTISTNVNLTTYQSTTTVTVYQSTTTVTSP
jgi:hypothetical protein